MGRLGLLLGPLPLLLVQICVPASRGLRCLRCERSGSCLEEECASDQELCRTTVLHLWEGEDKLEVVERSCAHPEKTNRTMSYRMGMQIITLSETVCGSNLCNRPNSVWTSSFPRSRYLECASCSSSDLSCERAREQSLQCRNPKEQCLEVVTHRSLEGSLRDEQHIRGCGYLPGCPGPTGFHNNQTFHFLRCCNTTKCNRGPVVELQHLPLNDFRCYSCEGNSTHGCSLEENSLINCRGPMNQCLEATGSDGYIVRGCATPSWCQGLHVAEAFSLTHVNVTCCTGNSCNHPVRDAQPCKGGAHQAAPAHLSFTFTLLIMVRLWGGTVLWI
ncbi:PREDICTED: urokinase plasminogen activator surface receptor [Condylura cristata]|uniref:urokinase plasminogen activator surface receptor n=1 Tax=Condylura cristata TaxID=143302 RepID=UPI000643A0C4|nr:PREDICTED: urokinase plasminogen activator surface receptor [Condylura cristata]